MPDKIKGLLGDLARAFLAGLAAAAAAAALFFVIGLMAGKGSLAFGLEMAKNVTLLIAALLLFLLAGMLLVKGKRPEKSAEGNGWRDRFRVIGYKTAAAVIAVAFLIVASLADWILLMIE